MNKARRKKINTIITALENIDEYNLIEPIKGKIEDILWEEENAYDNMPENLQYSMRGENSSDAIDSLQEAVDALEEAINIITTINNEEDKEQKEDEIDDYIDQAISNLEDIY